MLTCHLGNFLIWCTGLHKLLTWCMSENLTKLDSRQSLWSRQRHPWRDGSFLLTLSHHNRISHAFKQLPHHSVSVDSPWQQVVLMWDHEVSEKTLRQETKAHSFLLLPLGYFSLESHSKAIFTFTPGLEYSLLSEILLCYIILNWFYCIRHAVWNVTWLMHFMPHTNLHTQAKSHAT